MSLEEVEAFLIKKALARYNGNVSHAANALGLSRSALYRRLQRYGLVGAEGYLLMAASTLAFQKPVHEQRMLLLALARRIARCAQVAVDPVVDRRITLPRSSGR